MATRRIKLTNEGYATVNAEDYERLNKYRWHKDKAGYIARSEVRDGKVVTVLMHREIASGDEGREIDHGNRDRSDNRRENLRPKSRVQNDRNRAKQRNNTSGFKGVTWDASRSKWLAKTKYRGKYVHIGRYDERADAVRAYNQWMDTHRP